MFVRAICSLEESQYHS